MKANEIMKKYNISRSTLYRWAKENRIECIKLPSGQYDYGRSQHRNEDEKIDRKTIIYARVSTNNQKENLLRQIDRLKSFASAQGLMVSEVYSEIASALNYNRKQYKKLLEQIMNSKIDNIIIEYKDRLLRIGFEEFEYICNKFNTKIIIIDKTESKDIQGEIASDLISIIHHFSARVYSLRKNKSKIEQIISQK